MKKGEKKTFQVAAKDAYGEKEKTVDVDEEQLQDAVTKEFAKDALTGKLTRTIPLSDFQEKASTLKVGEVIKTETASATVKSIKDGQVELQIDNPDSPFYGKTIAVGATGSIDENIATITKITGDKASVTVENKVNNPFYGKVKKVGLKGTLSTGPEYEIIKISDGTITLKYLNQHPLAGKDITFDVQLQSVTKQASK